MRTSIKIGSVLVALLVLVVGVWFFFFRTIQTPPTPTSFTTGSFTSGGVSIPIPSTAGESAYTGIDSGISSTKKVFKIADGPITSATFVQTFNPTTTVARYIMQDNGHVFDVPVDMPGSVPRSVSNTTIPGVVRALWGEGGEAVVLQYQEGDVVKTVYIGFPIKATTTRATTTQASVTPTRVRFLPDNILDLAVSPDGKRVAYLLKAAVGVSGYTANLDGTQSKQTFSLPLTQVRLLWPASNTLLAHTKPALGVPGIAFSITTNGSVVPLLYAPGLSVLADSTFSKIIYQSISERERTTYSHDTTSGKDLSLSFQPFPEKCTWSVTAQELLYCATPTVYVDTNYLDLWHQGIVSASDSIVAFNTGTGAKLVISTPGDADGGVASDVAGLAVAISDKYLSFVVKGSRTLWGVRLAQ